jgi:translation initiation factor 3 subunit G|mmetsp:Transcript_17869/g.32349  ORF Transcript_17869/g.32349 Transcript_17869/m.32349 type:complete len:344 (-) Transcript_17869:27-1058(-)
MAGTRWGDEPDDSSTEGDEAPQMMETMTESAEVSAGGAVKIPPTHTSRVDARGIQTITSYKANSSNPSQLLKTTTKVRVTKDMVRENKDVKKRRLWKKFGQAAVDEDQSNVTIQSRDDIFLDDPNADTDLQEEDAGKALAGNLNAFWAKQQRRQLERKYDVDTTGGEPAAGAEGDGWQTVNATGKYVPPSARGGGAGTAMGGGAKSLAAMAEKVPEGGGRFNDANRDQNTIRVTNISEDTTEADLQELFQPFGRISRVYLAKDKETMISRGFAFVSFVHREDAASAMEKLQGFGYDHLILKLEWARPSAPKDPAAATEFRSGYGKALAQDTTEKVSFASNLTR